MTGLRSYSTVTDAYVSELRLTHRQGDTTSVPGRCERLGVAFDIANPVERLVLVPSRRANVVFNFAEALWYLAGRDDLAFISYYAPGLAQWSVDGRVMTGSAYGKRFFAFGGGALDQWESVLTLIRNNEQTTKAVVQVFDPYELLSFPRNPDIACTIALQLLVRNHELSMIAYMRANDAYRGAASDCFAFTFLQELFARRLDLGVGSYRHRVGSFHTLGSDDARINVVLADPWRGSAPGELSFPEMPCGENAVAISQVLEYEEALRHDRLRFSKRALELAVPDPYWQQIVALFELYRQIHHRTVMSKDVLDVLSPVLRRAMLLRWPALGAG